MDQPAAPAAPRVAAVVLAGGSGLRAGGSTNKVLAGLAGVPVLVHSVRTALGLPGLHRLVVVCREADRDAVADAVAPHLDEHDVWLVVGGSTRHLSETAALDALRAEVEAGGIDVVVLHDAARPLASARLWREVVARAWAVGGALPAVPASGILVRETLEPVRSQMTVQTPQAFRAAPLLAAYDAARTADFAGTDTSACVEAHAPGLAVVAVAGEPGNLKVTWPGDLATAEALLSAAG